MTSSIENLSLEQLREKWATTKSPFDKVCKSPERLAEWNIILSKLSHADQLVVEQLDMTHESIMFSSMFPVGAVLRFTEADKFSNYPRTETAFILNVCIKISNVDKIVICHVDDYLEMLASDFCTALLQKSNEHPITYAYESMAGTWTED